jgi:predicted dehydrogenase
VAVASRTGSAAEAFAGRHGFERSSADPLAVIADEEVDVVHILTPNTTHHEFASTALAAGKQVVCEKPIATTIGDAADLWRRAEEAGAVATVPFVYRFHPLVREARARVARGDLGDILTISGVYLQDWLHEQDATNWRVGAQLGGASRAVADIGSHLMDLVEFVGGSSITTVRARTLTAYPTRAGVPVESEDAATVIVTLADGALGTLTVSQVALGHRNDLTLEFSGSRAGVTFRQEGPDVLEVHEPEGTRLVARGSAGSSPDSLRLSTVPPGHPMGYQDAFDSFVGDSYRAMAGDVPEGLPTFADGLRSAILVDAVMESARTGATVEVAGSPALEAADVRR